MIIINNNKYSKDPFSDFKLKIKVEIIDNNYDEFIFFIYTNQTNIIEIRENLNSIFKDFKLIKIFYFTTKEEENTITELLNELNF